jgi:hypothetical protein
MSVEKVLARKGQRRILSIDGGGIRGIIALGPLEKIESVLRNRSGNPDLRLHECFDLIAGTSTGAIIAAALAFGMSVSEIKSFYAESGPHIFHKTTLANRLKFKYDAEGFEENLKNVFGNETLGSSKLRTLLMMVLRNATTDHPWIVTNIPACPFNDPATPDCNLRIPLWQLIRGSAAAPTFFLPETVDTGAHRFVFMDGATTPYNNPAFRAFLVATMDTHGLKWLTGVDRMMLVSVGTGTMLKGAGAMAAESMTVLYDATAIPAALISATTLHQDMLCRLMGNCIYGEPLERPLGDCIGTPSPIDPRLFSYLRYNVPLTYEGMADLGCGHIDPQNLPLDAINKLPELMEIADCLGQKVAAEHFIGFRLD